VVNNISAGNQFNLTVSGYQTPVSISQNQTYFNLTTYDNNSLPIDTINSSNPQTLIQFQETCLGCMTCNNNNLSQCTSCYTCTIDSNCLFKLDTAQCVNSCGNGYYANNTTNVCVSCSAGCVICNSTDCIQCIPNYNLYGTQCLEECLSGYYASQGKCLQCSSNCLNCSGLSDNCTSCQDNYGIAINSSTSVTYLCQMCNVTNFPYYNADNRTCVTCKPPCERCNQLVCLQCLSTYQGKSYLIE
jgi:hypothetical protein